MKKNEQGRRDEGELLKEIHCIMKILMLKTKKRQQYVAVKQSPASDSDSDSNNMADN